MEEVFAEYLEQLFYKGYAEKFKDDNPNAYESQLTEFKNLYSIPKHETSLVYKVRIEIETVLPLLKSVIELEELTKCSLSDTENIRIVETEILKSGL